MVNVKLLKEIILSKGLNIELLAKAIGINKTTLYRKLNNGGSTFYIQEIFDLCRILELKEDQIMAIFFNFYVA